MTKIMSCTCAHQYQDEVHGKDKRVHNQMTGDKKAANWRCTVCKGEKA